MKVSAYFVISLICRENRENVGGANRAYAGRGALKPLDPPLKNNGINIFVLPSMKQISTTLNSCLTLKTTTL